MTFAGASAESHSSHNNITRAQLVVQSAAAQPPQQRSEDTNSII